MSTVFYGEPTTSNFTLYYFFSLSGTTTRFFFFFFFFPKPPAPTFSNRCFSVRSPFTILPPPPFLMFSGDYVLLLEKLKSSSPPLQQNPYDYFAIEATLSATTALEFTTTSEKLFTSFYYKRLGTNEWAFYFIHGLLFTKIHMLLNHILKNTVVPFFPNHPNSCKPDNP
jgi:hypothetical protein